MTTLQLSRALAAIGGDRRGIGGVVRCRRKFAHAQAGDRAIRFILPVATASGVDTITRTASPALRRRSAIRWSSTTSRAPAASSVRRRWCGRCRTASRSASSPTTTSSIPSVYKSLPFDPIRDITPIAIVGTTPIVLVVNPAKVPAKNAQELIALLKARPGAYNYGSSGNGTILHLAAEMFLDEAGVKATHVPYKGVGPMLTDLIGGQVDFGTLSLPSCSSI